MAATMNENGPCIPMYSVKPYQCIDVVEVPNVMYKMNTYHSGSSHFKSSPSGETTPLAALERRQEDVLERLHQLKSSVQRLKDQYGITEEAVQATTAATTAAVGRQIGSVQSELGQGPGLLDLVISADPSSIPYSLVALCHQLASTHRVLPSTFVHSSVSCQGDVSDTLKKVLASGNGLKREDAQLALTLVWKKVNHGPQLVVDPTQQSAIQGEANIARYLSRLAQHPEAAQADIVRATQEDELLDLAQLQLVWGNSKEKAAALRSLNATLGKKSEGRAGWLLPGPEPCVADVVVWSALQQSGLAVGAPANVQKWLKLCESHSRFEKAVQLLS